MTAIPWRLIGIIGGAVALFFVIRWCANTIEKAGERDQAVADLAAYEAAVTARDEQAAKDRAEDEGRRVHLALKLEGVSAELEQLKANPITRVVYRDKTINGVVCPVARIGPDWFRVRSEAQAIADRAVSGSD